MPPEVARYLRDMLDAAHAIEQYSSGKSLDEYLQSRFIRDAINWNFCVIGEALTQLNRIDQATASQITDHSKIIALRNQLIHGYGVINHRITWDIVTTKLPLLVAELVKLLGP